MTPLRNNPSITKSTNAEEFLLPERTQSYNMVFEILFGHYPIEASPEESTDSLSSPPKLPQEKMFQTTRAPDVIPTTDEETDSDDSKELVESPKKVRFAMDDQVANRKRRNRNLRKHIIEKSRSTTESDRNSDRSSDNSRNDMESPRNKSSPKNRIKTTPRKNIPLTPKAADSPGGRRRNNIKMAACLFGGIRC